MKLKITRLNNPPTPVNGKYDPDTIYLIRTSTGSVRMVFTSPDGTLVGESIQENNIIVTSNDAQTPSVKAPLMWMKPSTGELYVKTYIDGTWGWKEASPNTPVMTGSDFVTVSDTAPPLPSSKVFWFNPNTGGGLHIQVDEDGSKVWKQTDFLDETLLQQKVEEAQLAAQSATASAVQSQTAETQIQQAKSSIDQSAAQVAADRASVGTMLLSVTDVINTVNLLKSVIDSTAQTVSDDKAQTEIYKNDTAQLKQDVVTLIAAIQAPDLSGVLLKSDNLASLADKSAARQNLGLGAMAVKDSITGDDVKTALGYTPADEAVIGQIQAALDAILAPITVPGGGGNGGEIPA